MSSVLAVGKRSVTYVVTVATILWSVGFAAMVSPLTAQAANLSCGTLIKRSDLSTVYYYCDGGRYTFPNQVTFMSWYKDFKNVTTITADEMAAIPLVDNIVMRAGTYLVKITTDPKVYAVEPGGVLRWVKTEEVAKGLWGSAWGKMVKDVPDAFFTNYTVGSPLDTAKYPSGSLVKDGSDWYYVDNGMKRKVTTATFASNHFNEMFAASASLASYTAGSDLGATEVADSAQAGKTPTTPGTGTPSGSLTISLSSESPTGGSVVVDTATTHSQRFAQMTLVQFKAMGGEAVVTEVMASRTGISKDSDVDEVFLMDGDKILAKSSSISKGKITWSNSSGLFTVPANGTKSIWVTADINEDAGSGTTIGFTVDSAKLAGSGSVSGSAVGANKTVATASDLGYLEIATSSPTSATTVDADPAQEKELGKFKFDAVDQDILVKNVTLTQIGTVEKTDLREIKISVAGTQYGATLADLGDNKLVFDFTGHADGGLKVTAGQSKFLDIRGKVAGGTNRTFKFSVQNQEDVRAWDMEYNVYASVVSDNTTTFTVETTAQTTVNTGTLTIQVSKDSPQGNIADGATNITLAEFDLTAAGEEMKLTSLSVQFTGTGSNENIKNVKLLLNGTQVGTTVASSTAVGANTSLDADFTFSNNFTIAAGATKKMKVIVDTTGDNIASADTLRATLVAGSSNGQGKISLSNISTASVSGYTLTVAAGAPTLSENLSMADGSSSNPTAVLNTKNAKISSFVIQAGGGEGSKITNITMKADTATGGLAGAFVNLRLQHNGVDIAPVKGTLTSGTTDTFDYTLTTALILAKSEQYVIDVVADVKSTTSTATNTDTNGVIYPSSVTYQTSETGQSGTATMSAGLQNVFIDLSGTLTLAISADTPSEHYVLMGGTNEEVGRYKLTSGKQEPITVSELVVSFVSAYPANAITGVVGNIRLMEGDKMIGQAVASLDTASATGTTSSTAYAKFSNLTYEVGKNASKTLRVLVDLTAQPDSLSSSSFYTSINLDYDTSGNDALTARGAESGTALSSITGLTLNGSIGKFMHPLKTILSVAHASDAPSGASSKGDDKVVAKWVFTNTSNVNSQAATLQLLNLKVDTSISAAAGHAARQVKVYKASVSDSNLLITTTYVGGTTVGSTGVDLGAGADDTNITEASFSNVTIEAGQSETILVTMDTDDAAANNTLTVGLVKTGGSALAGTASNVQGISWSDGQTTVYDLKPTSSGIGGLPFVGKTLTY